jgi:hypothetical protein
MAEDTLNNADANNFGNDLAAKEGAPGGYIANFNGDEIDGKTYKLGDKIDDSVDAGTLAYLQQIGRITAVGEGGEAPSGGEGGTGVPTGQQNGNANVELSDAEQAEADQLVADNSAEQLRDMIPEGQSTSGTKADLAARIVAGRR